MAPGLYATVGGMTEQRWGGTLAGRVAPDGQPLLERQDTDRIDAGLAAVLPRGWHGSARPTVFAEAALGGGDAWTSWLGGVE